MKRIIKFIINNYWEVLLIMLLVLSSSKLICENDLFFDLKTGDDILKNGLTFKEHFSFIPGLTYIYLHWFYDIFIYFIYKLSGFGGLYIFFVFIESLFFIFFYREIYKLKKDKLISLITTLIAFWVCKGAFVSRVQSISYLLLFFEVLSLEKLYTTGNKKYSVILVLLSILVVNLQMPIWIFYLILTLPFIAESIMSKVFKNKFNECYNYKVFYITIFIIVISGLVSPYGLIPYTYCLKSLGNPIYDLLGIKEMKQTILIAAKPVLIISLLFVITNYFKWLKLSFRDFCLVCGLFLFSLIVYKNVIYYCYFGIFILIKNLDLKFIINKLSNYYTRINIAFIELFLIVICTVGFMGVIRERYTKFEEYGYSYYPVGMIDYIKENLDYKNIKLYTDYSNGSFYLFNDIKVFVDSRAEVYMKEYNGGNDILQDYVDLKSYKSYKNVLNKYKFDYLSLSAGNPLFEFLIKEEGYCIIYRSYDYFLFERFEEKDSIRIN